MNEEKLMAIYMELTGATEGLARSVIIHLDMYHPRDFVQMLDADRLLYPAHHALVQEDCASGPDPVSADESLGGGWQPVGQQPSLSLAK